MKNLMIWHGMTLFIPANDLYITASFQGVRDVAKSKVKFDRPDNTIHEKSNLHSHPSVQKYSAGRVHA